MTGTPAVLAQDLVKVFRGKREVRALDGVSLAVEEASVLGLLGPNGAGKTTAVRILTTVSVPDSGRGWVLGHDVVQEADVVRRLIGLAGQYAAVDENLTGRENLRMVGRLCHLSKSRTLARADTLLEQFGLTDAANRPLKTYSGGMRRRLDLAAALVAEPPVLFLDEPTTGLDPQSRQDLWLVIEQLVGAGTTVLLTTQYLEEADRLADRIAVVDHGKVIAEGTPADLKAQLGTTVVSITLADAEAVTRAVPVLSALTARPPVVDGTSVGLTVESGPATAAEALRSLDQLDIAIVGLALREPSLDDVFLRLTGHRTETGDGPDGAAPDGDGNGRESTWSAATRRPTVRPRGRGHGDQWPGSRRMSTGAATLAGSGGPPLGRPASSGAAAATSPGSALRWAVTDAATVTWRNLVRMTRIPDAVFFSSIQPIMFVLLFRYCFGGAITIPGVHYVNYLIAGVYVQTIMFGAVATSVGLAEDLHSGLIERFRALPMSRSAVLAGRTLADAVRNVFVLVLITGVGYAVGFRVQTTFGRFLCGLLLVLAFAYTLSWTFAIIGLTASNSEAAQLAAFPILFPFTFASSAFVNVQSMPGWLQAFAVHQPVSQVIDAARELMLGAAPHPGLWSSSSIWQALAWTAGLLVVFSPIAVRKYRQVG